MTFKEIFNDLQTAYHKKQESLFALDYHSNKAFWEVIGMVDDKQLIFWAERTTRIKTPLYAAAWIPTEWTRLCSIVDQVNNKKHDMSVKQKRFTALMVCKYWDDLCELYP